MPAIPFATAQIARAREVSEAFMADTCEIRRTGSRELSEITNITAAPTTTVVFTGPCRVSPSGPNTTELGSDLVTWKDAEIYVPVAATGIEIDDYLVITASLDPSMSGKAFRITNVTSATWRASVKLSALAL
jgi:hypothetical protein